MTRGTCLHGISFFDLCFDCQAWIAEMCAQAVRDRQAEPQPVQLTLFDDEAA